MFEDGAHCFHPPFSCPVWLTSPKDCLPSAQSQAASAVDSYVANLVNYPLLGIASSALHTMSMKCRSQNFSFERQSTIGSPSDRMSIAFPLSFLPSYLELSESLATNLQIVPFGQCKMGCSPRDHQCSGIDGVRIAFSLATEERLARAILTL